MFQDFDFDPYHYKYLFDETVAMILAMGGGNALGYQIWSLLRVHHHHHHHHHDDGIKSSDNNTNEPTRQQQQQQQQQQRWQQSLTFGIVQSLTIASRVYLLLVGIEWLLQFPALSSALSFLGATSEEGQDETTTSSRSLHFKEAAPTVALSTWLALMICRAKHAVLLHSVSGSHLGRLTLLDRLGDFCVVLVASLIILDQLQINMSLGLQSLLSAGGVGALVFSLASRGFAEQLVGGLALGAWDDFNLGDMVRLQDGTEGIVKDIGLIDSQVQQFDNIVQRIPNGQLAFCKLSNISRVKQSRLLQMLRFQYSDLEKLPTVLQEIKVQITESCPKAVSDGSKAFWAVLCEYKADHIEAMVMVHFNIPPMTTEFAENRQEFMLAIARAMKKHNVKFALPSIVYRGREREE